MNIDSTQNVTAIIYTHPRKPLKCSRGNSTFLWRECRVGRWRLVCFSSSTFVSTDLLRENNLKEGKNIEILLLFNPNRIRRKMQVYQFRFFMRPTTHFKPCFSTRGLSHAVNALCWANIDKLGYPFTWRMLFRILCAFSEYDKCR